MTAHEDLQNDIPAYVTSRLDGEARRDLEEHLESCDLCAERVASFREIASALRAEGDALLEPHPDALALRIHAQGGAADAAIMHHLRLCAACQLEVTAATPRPAVIGPPTCRPPRRRPAALVAAGVLLGVALAVLFRILLPSGASQGEEGPAQLVFLRPLRGGEIVQRARIGPDERVVVLAVQPPIPETADEDQRFRFEVRRSDGPVVWSADVRAATIRTIVARADVVTLPVPTAKLPPGRYELGLTGPEAAPLLRIPFEIAGGD